jgi:hypothetical protein
MIQFIKKEKSLFDYSRSSPTNAICERDHPSRNFFVSYKDTPPTCEGLKSMTTTTTTRNFRNKKMFPSSSFFYFLNLIKFFFPLGDHLADGANASVFLLSAGCCQK